MKLESNDLVAINFYDDRGDSTKKRAIGKVIMGTGTTPPSDYCRVELIYPPTCKGTQIGVLVNDLRHLNAKVTVQQGSIVWEEIVLGLARELDDKQQPQAVALSPTPTQTDPVTNKIDPELPKPATVTSQLKLSDKESPRMMATPSESAIAGSYSQSDPFTVDQFSPALGKFCQNCTEKIAIGEKVIERTAISRLNVANSDPNRKFYAHAENCSYEGGTSDFGQGTGGGQRVVRSAKNLGG